MDKKELIESREYGLPRPAVVHEGLGVLMKPITNYMQEYLHAPNEGCRQSIVGQACKDIRTPIVKFTDLWAD